LKFQAGKHIQKKQVFQVKTENGNLVFFFGDASTHAGNFTFQTPAGGKLKSGHGQVMACCTSYANLRIGIRNTKL
jgi:hypothetical protein